jgi:hypothetical protein
MHGMRTIAEGSAKMLVGDLSNDLAAFAPAYRPVDLRILSESLTTMIC